MHLKARQARQLERKNLRTLDIALVLDARELTQGQEPILIQDAAFRAHASQGGTLASQIGQILGCLLAKFASARRPCG